MKKLFSVLGIFALFFGLSSFKTNNKLENNIINKSTYWFQTGNGMCAPASGSCSIVPLDTLVAIK